MASPILVAFLDLVRLADHPSDLFSYRHFQTTPLAAAMYPEGVPPALEVSRAAAELFASVGLAEGLARLRERLPADTWSAAEEGVFSRFVAAAAEFEKELTATGMISDFSGDEI